MDGVKNEMCGVSRRSGAHQRMGDKRAGQPRRRRDRRVRSILSAPLQCAVVTTRPFQGVGHVRPEV